MYMAATNLDRARASPQATRQYTALHLREMDDGYRITRDSTKEDGSEKKAVRREKQKERHHYYHLEHG